MLISSMPAGFAIRYFALAPAHCSSMAAAAAFDAIAIAFMMPLFITVAATLPSHAAMLRRCHAFRLLSRFAIFARYIPRCSSMPRLRLFISHFRLPCRYADYFRLRHAAAAMFFRRYAFRYARRFSCRRH